MPIGLQCYSTLAGSPGELKGQGDLQRGALEAVLGPEVELSRLAISRHRRDFQVPGVKSLAERAEKCKQSTIECG